MSDATPPVEPGTGEPPDAAAAHGGLGSRLHARHGWWSRGRLVLAGSAAVVVLAAIGVGGFMLSSSGSTKAATPPKAHHHTGTTVVSRTKAKKVVVEHPPSPPTCPLTGLPAPHGGVPQRPVLAVKVGNNPTARPQSGLENADIVFDTLAEGGITRYIAVYQCGSSSSVGPIRSVRWDDWHILQMFGRADLSFVHGIDPDVNTVESLPWVCDLDAFTHPSPYQQNPARVAPDATYTSTAALWSACPTGKAPPSIFAYAASPPHAAGAVAAVEIPYSVDGDVVWQWSATHRAFMHNFRNYGAIDPDTDSIGAQLRATNVVIEVVSVSYGAYVETPGSTGDVESNTEGGGVAYVLSGGKLQAGTWSRPNWADVTKLVGHDGKPMVLRPGNTWVEIVPNSVHIAFTR